MKRKRKKEKGFSLVELLATIIIITLVTGIAGYTIINSINHSKNKTELITYTNLKSSARYYVEENPTTTIWEKSTANPEQTYSCISIESLINNGYISKKNLENYNGPDYILITKGKNQSIISEELDTEGTCQEFIKKVPIPKSKDYCNNLTYSGSSQQLTTISQFENKFQFSNYMATNAGSYVVTATLYEDYVWEDGSTSDKEITCNIKKASPIVSITPDSPSDDSSLENLKSIITTFSSNVDGSIGIKSSNSEYAKATVDDYNVIASQEKNITIIPLAYREATTYITITFTPSIENINNYYSKSVIFFLGKVGKKPIEKPTAEVYCKKDLVYNKTNQTLVKSPLSGFGFINSTATNAGVHQVTATLKYGYIWDDGTTEPVTITCSISKATPKFSLNKSKEEIYKGKNTAITATSDVGGKITVSGNSNYISVASINPNTISNNASSTITITGKEITSSYIPITITLTPTDQINYYSTSATYNLKVSSNSFTLTYNSNGGSACNPSSKTITQGVAYGTLCTPTRTGYTFSGWYTSKTGGTQVTSSTKATGSATIYAHWTPKTIKVTFHKNIGTTTTKTVTYTYGVANQKFDISWSRTGYTASGWAKTSTGSKVYNWNFGVSNDWINTSGSSIDLYAVWTPKTIQVTFHKNDGTTTTKKVTYTYGVANQRFNISWTRDYYTASGWAPSSTGSKVYNWNSGVSDNWINTNSPSIHLYAVWTRGQTYYYCRSGNTCLNVIPNWRDCTSTAYSTNSNPTSVTIIGMSSGYYKTQSGYYIYPGCLKNNINDAKVNCASTCVG